jgi:hypothetical protein
MRRRLPLAVLVNERLLVAVAGSKAVMALSARAGQSLLRPIALGTPVKVIWRPPICQII